MQPFEFVKDKKFHGIIYWACDYLSTLRLKLTILVKGATISLNPSSQNTTHLPWLYYIMAAYALVHCDAKAYITEELFGSVEIHHIRHQLIAGCGPLVHIEDICRKPMNIIHITRTNGLHLFSCTYIIMQLNETQYQNYPTTDVDWTSIDIRDACSMTKSRLNTTIVKIGINNTKLTSSNDMWRLLNYF